MVLTGKIIIAAGLAVLLLSACQSEYERRGVSHLPQNRPTQWEGNAFNVTR